MLSDTEAFERLQKQPYKSQGFPAFDYLSLLPIMPRSIGYEQRAEDEYYRLEGKQRKPAMGLLQYSLTGMGGLLHQGKKYEVPAGSLMLLHWPHDHCYYLPKSSSWEFIYCTFSGAPGLALSQIIETDSSPVIKLGHDHKISQNFVSFIEQGISDKGLDPLIASAQLYEILMQLFSFSRSNKKNAGEKQLFAAVEEYAEKHLHLNIGVDDLARSAGLSRYHFSREFKNSYGSSPGNWLQAIRLQRAMSLLQESDENLESIAQLCGFQNSNYFGKVFRKHYGMTPHVLRSSLK